MTRSINRIRSAATVGFAVAGAAMTSFVASGLNEAGKFELAMKNVSIATGATGNALRSLQNQAISISGNTSQSASTIAAEMAMAGRAGLNQSQVRTMMPTLAAYADVQMRSHGTDPTKSVSEVVQAAHMMGAYGNKTVTFMGKKMTDLQAMVEWMNRMSFAQPEDMSKAVTQMGYFAPQGVALGMTMQDIMGGIVAMGQNGYLRGKGGTGLAALINGAMNTVSLTGHRANAKAEALRGLGLVDANGKPVYTDKSGHLMWQQMAAHLRVVAQNTKPANLHNMFSAAFGTAGGRFADVMFSPGREHQRQAAIAKMAHLQSVPEMQAEYLKPFLVSLNLLKTNIATAMAVTFLPLAQTLAPYLHKFADEVMKFALFVSAHPDLGLKISLGAVGAAVALLAPITVRTVAALWSLPGALDAVAVASRNASAAALLNAVPAGGVRGPAAVVAAEGAAVKTGGGLWGTITKAVAPILDGTLLARMFTPVGFGAKFGSGFFGDMMKGLTSAIGILARPLTGLIGGVLRLALGFSNVIGWVMLAITAIQLFHQHATDIGWVLGVIGGFIAYKLWPAIANGFTSIFTGLMTIIGRGVGMAAQGITSFFSWMFKQIRDFFSNPIKYMVGMRTNEGNFAGGLLTAAQTDWEKFTRGIVMGLNTQNPNAFAFSPALSAPMSTIPGARGTAASAPGAPSVVHHHNGDVNININNKTPKETANEVAKVFSREAPFQTRAAGGSLQNPYWFNVTGIK